MIKIPRRKKGSHKGDNGRILIIGGSKDYPGAITLAALALCCLRTGTDMVTVAAPERVAWTINCFLSDIITKKLKGDYLKAIHSRDIEKLANNSDVILIGPGIGQKQETKKLVLELLKDKRIKNMPKVIDADALKIIKLKDTDNSVLTPHRKEFEILLRNSRLAEKSFRKELKNNIILLKGHVDKIISKNKTIMNKTGNEGMTVGGTGDVLAGVCAGLVSQGMTLFDAAHTSAYLVGKIGDRLKKKMGNSFIASDFLAEIPVEMKRLKKIK